MRPLVLFVAVAAAVGFAEVGSPSPQVEKQQPVTLLGLLHPWRYPGSTMLDGATIEDAGNPAFPSTFCHSVLTTPDPVDRVVAFYAGSPSAGVVEKSRSHNAIKASEGGCILVQDDSKNRRAAVKVIVVTKPHSTTTLVVTRTANEPATHIAWTHHLRHPGSP